MIKLIVWQSLRDAQWYWQMKSKNGRIIADGAEGYSKKSGAIKAVKKIMCNEYELIINGIK